MISYREKQLLSVMKLLQDDTIELSNNFITVLDNMENSMKLSTSSIFSESINDYNELIDLAESRGYDTLVRVEDLLSPEELKYVENNISNIEEQFSRKTGIKNKKDLSFLVIAVALQCIRQYFLTSFTNSSNRPNDQEGAKQIKKEHKEHSDRKGRYYNPSLEEIISNPVPFDANVGSNGALKGTGKLGHRSATIGHDPLLGLFFGTMNIATRTLTTTSFQSYHITTLNKKDAFRNKADMSKIIAYSKSKLLDQGKEGKVIIVASLLKEIQHLRSDVNTKNSLGLPVITTINPQMASELATHGFDMCNFLNVGKQATYAIFIDTLIGLLYLSFDKVFMEDYQSLTDLDKKLIQVRLRKILMLSNVLASTSNAIYVAITKDTSKLDVGGMLVTLSHLMLDRRFIAKIKKEYIDSILSEQLEERLKEIEKSAYS